MACCYATVTRHCGRAPLEMPHNRRSWTAEESKACFIVRDHAGQALACVYFEGGGLLSFEKKYVLCVVDRPRLEAFKERLAE